MGNVAWGGVGDAQGLNVAEVASLVPVALILAQRVQGLAAY